MSVPAHAQERIAGLHARLCEELCSRIEGLARDSSVSVAFQSPGSNWERLVPSPCPLPDIPLGEETGASTGDALVRLITFDTETAAGCRLLLYGQDPCTPALLDCLTELAKSIATVHEVSGREDLLLQELAASWESLAALYESGLDLQSSDSLKEVIDRLLDRCVSAGPDVAAILWVREQDDFRVVAERNCFSPEPRSASKGLLGSASLRGTPVVLDGAKTPPVEFVCEPELVNAGPIVLIPVRTRQGLEATLQVWGKAGSAMFESPAVRLLEAIALQAANTIENDRLYHAALEGERMRQEMEIGTTIQQHLLLGDPPRGLSGVEIANYMLPALEVGGDFYQFIRHSDTCFDAIVGDVMGKGVAAALMGAATKNAILRVIAEAGKGCVAESLPQPKDIVTATNLEMSPQLIHLSSFVTLFYARFDLRANALTYVQAGHTETLHYSGGSNSTEFLHGDGCPLGFIEGEVYQQSVIPLGSGDIVLIYSDGISEAANSAGELFGSERLARFLEMHAAESAGGIAKQIASEVTAYRGSEALEDDLTCMVIRISGDGNSGHVHRTEIAGNLDELERLRDWIHATLCEKSPFPPSREQVFNVQLAVQEAVSNVILHGLTDPRSQLIAVEIRFQGTSVTIALAYPGLPFSPENIPPPSFDGSRDHGFGVYIMDQLMDCVTYAWADGQNTITLTKDLA